MVVIKLIETGQEFDTTGVKITYVKQNGDLGDITKANTSFTWGFKMPKTKRNTEILKGLGMIGDLSNAPYIKIYCSIVDNGVEIVQQGLLKVKETSKEYKAYVQDGIIEFYNEVKVDTISGVLDLESLRHQNTIDTIIASQQYQDYRYIIADYNYQKQDLHNGITNLRQVGLIPSVSFKFLWDKIFKHYGWTYSGNFDLTNDWLSYPTVKDFETIEGDVVLYIPYSNQTSTPQDSNACREILNGIAQVDLTKLDPIVGEYNRFTVLTTGTYKAEIQASGYFKYLTPENGGTWEYEPYFLTMFVNGVAMYNDRSNPNNISTIYDPIQLHVGDEIHFMMCSSADTEGVFDATYTTEGVTAIKLNLTSVVTIDWELALIKYKIKDFFKEVLIRKAITPFADVQKRHIKFLTLDERLNAEVDDWSDKYVKRLSEKYIYNSYAQNNYFRHKYDEDNEDYSDGVLVVDNENIPIEKDIYKSKIYAPLELQETFTTNMGDYLVRNYKMWDIETKINENDVVEVEYKAIKNRFYVLQTDGTDDYGIYIDGFYMENFSLAKNTGGLYIDIVEQKYSLIRAILDRSRIHEIEVILSKAEMSALTLEKLIFFEKQRQVYLLNKIIWKEGKTIKGEFIRLNK